MPERPEKQVIVRVTSPSGREIYYPCKGLSIQRAVDIAVATLDATLTGWAEGPTGDLSFRPGLIEPHSELAVFLRSGGITPTEGLGAQALLSSGTVPRSFDRPGDELMFAGRLDRLEVDGSTSGGVAEVRVSAREHGADLVDCTLPEDFVGEQTSSDLSQMFRSACANFEIAVRAASLGDNPSELGRFVVEPTATALETLARYAQIDGLLIFSTPTGMALVPAGDGPDPAPLGIHQRNVERFSFTRQTQERFAALEIVGQGDNSLSSIVAGIFSDDGGLSNLATVYDEGGGPTYRRRALRIETGGGEDAIQRRAEWEVATRIARSEALSVRLAGWQMLTGSTGESLRPWSLNRTTEVEFPAIGLYASLLIAAASFTLDEKGFSTQLTLVRPDAFTPQPVIVAPSDPDAMFGSDGS